jgi:O-antigen/teichoic acid export membrane protein
MQGFKYREKVGNLSTIPSKNIWYGSISIIIPSIFTYIFWFLTAKIAGPETVGIASSIASLVIIIATIDGLDMSLGMKRMLAIAISSKDFYKSKQILVSTVVFVCIIAVISSILIAIPSLRILEIIGIERQYTWIIIAMIFAQSLQYIFMEAIIAALKSKTLVIPFLVGSVARFPIFFGIYFLVNNITLATIIAFSSLLFITSISFGIYLVKMVRTSPKWSPQGFFSIVKGILVAGLSSWIPHTANVAGYWLGIIAVFSSQGSAEGGKFYISIGIFTITLFILTGITKVTHALVASIDKKEEQTALLLYYMKIAFVFSLPIATPLLYFSANFLGLMGEGFGSASATLSIFVISLPILIVSEMIYYFVYGLGDHRAVLYLGLVGNVPRIILYFLLSPILGINGAAVSFLIGSAVQFLASVKVRNTYNIALRFREYVTITLIPIIVGALLWAGHINFVISTIIIIVGSLLLYAKLALFTTEELRDIMYAILPRSIAERTYPVALKMMKKIQ